MLLKFAHRSAHESDSQERPPTCENEPRKLLTPSIRKQGTEELPEGAGTHAVHRTRLQIHQDRPGDVATARRLVVVDIDPLQLQVRVTMVGPGRVDAVLVRDHLPELGAWASQRESKSNTYGIH